MGIGSLRRNGQSDRAGLLPYADTSPLAAKFAELGLKTWEDVKGRNRAAFTEAENATIDERFRQLDEETRRQQRGGR